MKKREFNCLGLFVKDTAEGLKARQEAIVFRLEKMRGALNRMDRSRSVSGSDACAAKPVERDQMVSRSFNFI